MNRTKGNINMDLFYNIEHISISRILGTLIQHLNNPSMVQLILVIQGAFRFQMHGKFQDILDTLLLQLVLSHKVINLISRTLTVDFRS